MSTYKNCFSIQIIAAWLWVIISSILKSARIFPELSFCLIPRGFIWTTASNSNLRCSAKPIVLLKLFSGLSYSFISTSATNHSVRLYHPWTLSPRRRVRLYHPWTLSPRRSSPSHSFEGCIGWAQCLSVKYSMMMSIVSFESNDLDANRRSANSARCAPREVRRDGNDRNFSALSVIGHSATRTSVLVISTRQMESPTIDITL